jgi:hypothetical protein
MHFAPLFSSVINHSQDLISEQRERERERERNETTYISSFI